MILTLEDNGIGLEVEVQDGVHKGEVHRAAEDNRLVDKHQEWATEDDAHLSEERALWRSLSQIFGLRGALFAMRFAMLRAQNWHVRFRHRDEKWESGSRNEKASPERPPPSDGRDEAGDDGTQERWECSSKHEPGHRESALMGVLVDIREETTQDGIWCRAS